LNLLQKFTAATLDEVERGRDIALRCPRRRAQRQATETNGCNCANVLSICCAATRRGRRGAPSLPPICNAASILVGLLWCLALLSLIVIGVLHTARMDLLVVKNYGDKIQAHYLALAGIEKAEALLFRDAKDRSHNKKNHSGNFYNDASSFREVKFGRGTFSVLRRGRSDEGGGIIFGVSDEESRLNANTADTNALGQLQNMTPDVATAIINWHGGDSTANAAETQYYTGLQPPYQPRNGPFQTVRELLMVRGVTPELLLGKDRQQNGLLGDIDENGNDANASVDSADLGWAANLTVDSSVQNVDAAGDARVNIQTADENSLTVIQGITSPIAKAIVAYRGQHQFQSIADLLDVTPQNLNQNGAQNSNSSGDSDSGKVVSQNLFMEIADGITVASDQNLPGAININTAGLDVLVCLPGMTRELAQAVISQRSSGGFFANTGELLKVPNLTRDIFKQIAPLVTARSETYRILSEGKITSTGARQRIQAIVHIGLSDVKLLSWREDDL
jgi:DNA uptake protein ComE-like DNA-binding protein